MAFPVEDMEEFSKMSNNHTIHFESPSHTGILLCGLNSLRSKNLLVDVTLVAGGQAFEVSICKKAFEINKDLAIDGMMIFFVFRPIVWF